MNTATRTLLRWSGCELNDSFSLPPPPEFCSDDTSLDVSVGFLTSTQVSPCQESPPKKKHCTNKLSKKEALDILASASKSTDAAAQILNVLADRTFSDIEEGDLKDLERAQENLRRKLDKLAKHVKSRSFKYLKSKVSFVISV